MWSSTNSETDKMGSLKGNPVNFALLLSSGYMKQIYETVWEFSA